MIDLASEYENEQGLELFCGTCLVECCALLSQGQTWVSSGRKYVLNHGQLCSGVALLGDAMGVVPHALLLSVEPVSVAGSPPSFTKKAVAKQHEFKGRSRMFDFLFIIIYSLYSF